MLIRTCGKTVTEILEQILKRLDVDVKYLDGYKDHNGLYVVNLNINKPEPELIVPRGGWKNEFEE